MNGFFLRKVRYKEMISIFLYVLSAGISFPFKKLTSSHCLLYYEVYDCSHRESHIFNDLFILFYEFLVRKILSKFMVIVITSDPNIILG